MLWVGFQCRDLRRPKCLAYVFGGRAGMVACCVTYENELDIDRLLREAL